MLKFNLTQEGKGLIDALQGDAKLAITKVLLRGSGFDNNTSKEITSFKGAVCNDGTGNGAYVVIDINDNSNSNYSCNVIELFSDQTKIATQCANEQSGYEVTLYCGERGRSTYPSVTYRTQTWTSGKTPTNVQLSASMGYPDKQCGISMFGGGVEGGSAQFDFENGNFPKTITLANGDVWVTNETVSAAGVTEQADYYASSENGATSIRPLFSKVLIQKESNKQLKLRVSCQFDGAEKCKFNTTSINLPYATKFREGVIRLADPSEVYGKDGQRYNTVYSAKDVDAKISQVTGSLGNLKDYAKINAENTFAENNTFTKSITVNGEIGGNAVATKGLANEKDALVVSLGFANDKYLSKQEAGTTYLTQTVAADTYLSKTEASSTYLTQTDATATYLKKADAETAAANYAKLNADNEFNAGTTNTFNGNVTVKGTFVVGPSQEVTTFMVTGDSISGNAIQNDTVVDSASNKLPTEGAVKRALDDAKSALTAKDNDLQSQIDGINAGQNLADIVNNTTELEGYNVSHLKAKGDYQRGTSGATWAIGDKVQVLGGGDVQSSVYELVKGDFVGGETKDIQSTNNTAYYWRYIGVYGINAYTKAEIDKKVGEINSAISTKADTSHVNTELAKKVDKTQIATTISDATASDEKIPSEGAVKTYVDGKVDGINTTLENYVTVDTTQEITGAKTFANGNITIANKDNKTSHYVTIGSANTNDSGYKSGITHNDITHSDFAEESFTRAGSGDNVSYTSSLLRHGTDRYTFGSKLEQHIGTHYKYTASDMYMTTGDPNEVSPLPAAQIGTPGNTGSADISLTENYVERIRLRKNTSVAGDADIEFLPAGQSVTDIDLFADNINNVFNNEVSFRVCTTADGGAKTDTPVLSIHSSGVYYHTQAGNTVGETEYQLRTAGSLDFETSITNDANDSHLPTSLAVKNYVATTVDAKITELQGGMSYLKLTSSENQTVNSNVAFNGIVSGSAVATRGLASEEGTKLPTEGAVVSFVNDKLVENRSDISDKTKVGAMGLFLYTGGDFKEMGTEVAGTSLQSVGMQLPMDGVVSWSQGTTAMAGTWKLLNNTIAGEPCLVLAIRVG